MSDEVPQQRRRGGAAEPAEAARSRDRRDGAESPACILEVVSRLAGEPWTDRPTSVHSTLGSIARVAYQHSSAEGRAALLPMARALVDTASVGFEAPARLVATCVATALASPNRDQITVEESQRLATARATALYLLGRCGAGTDTSDRDHVGDTRGAPRWWMRVLDPFRLTEPFYRVMVAPDAAAAAVAVTARASGDDRDQRLRQLLRWCIAVTVQARPAPADAEDPRAAETTRAAPGTDASDPDRESRDQRDDGDEGPGPYLRGV
jgi:hypothetical protein